MALFGKEDNGESAMARSSGGDARPDQLNMVGKETVLEGTLRAESDVRVSGHIKGMLDVEGRAIVTQEGVVEGELRATDADVAGSVQGEIHVSERLMLKSAARIDGNVAAGRIKVEEGALFTGQCDIGENVSEKVQKQLDEKGMRKGDASAPGGSLPEEGTPRGSDDSNNEESAPRSSGSGKGAEKNEASPSRRDGTPEPSASGEEASARKAAANQ
ncbi:MAG: polymer-forming cytoskeletal protein [Bacteroidetes bacterium QS_9_68_14]|nr:MAG: polymer-forming cytoskeletal protein [Bacteroidetes bacterium QS_9_68_14]